MAFPKVLPKPLVEAISWYNWDDDGSIWGLKIGTIRAVFQQSKYVPGERILLKSDVIQLMEHGRRCSTIDGAIWSHPDHKFEFPGLEFFFRLYILSRSRRPLLQ